MSPDTYTLALSAKKTGVLQDYEIVSDIDPSVISVKVDRYRESEFTVEPEISFTPKADYYVGNTILSSSKVILSGPETEISKIKKVKVKSSVPGEVRSTITLKLPITMYDAYDQPITSKTISSSVSEIEASIPVLMKNQIEITPDLSNLPEGLTLKKEYKDMIKVNPSTLEIAGPEDTVSSLKSVKLDALNFNNVNLQNNKFTLPINLPQGCKSLNNIYSAEISLNMLQFREKSLSINQFSFKNVPQNKTANIYNGNMNVSVLAPVSEINSVKASDITAEIDLEGKSESSSSMEMPVKLAVKGHNGAWIYGKYFVNVSLT
jgi:YbbR domain-containing protein